MLLKSQQSISSALLASLEDPEFCDVRIESSDGGEIKANKAILRIRSEYFNRMFSPSNNFVESSTGLCKLPYPSVLVKRVINCLYSGEMDLDDLALEQLLDLLGLLDLMNLTEEFKQVERYTEANINIPPSINNRFSKSEMLKNLDKCFAMRMENLGETLLTCIGCYIAGFCQLEEVGLLSETMIIRLLQENKESYQRTILRLKTFVTWLSTNSMNEEKKDEVLETFDFDFFTLEQLGSDVRTSGLYSSNKILTRMEKLCEENEKKFKEKSFHSFETKAKLDHKEAEIRNLKDRLRLKDLAIFDLEEDLKEKETILEEKSAEMSVKDEEITKLKESLQKALENKRKMEDSTSEGSEGKIKKLN